MKLGILLPLLVPAVSAAILGLDYGQQFTKAVLLAPGIPFDIVLTDEGKRKDLSGISIRSGKAKDDLERVYGSQTGSLCTRFPQSCILDIKPLLGKSLQDPATKQYLKQHYGVNLIEDERSGSIKFDLGFANQSYAFTVEEILAMNLNEFKARALNDLHANPHAIPIVEDVAISVPPYATPETRQSYLDALQLANFSNVLGLVDEGTAVAVNYLSNKKFESADYNDVKEYHLVYDMGAGSTTATLFSFTPYKNGSIVLELESIGYDESYGGKLLSDSLYVIISEKFLHNFNLEHSDLTPKIVAKIVETSEKAKLILSTNNDYHVGLESIYNDKDFRTVITRDEFEEINSDLMTRITTPILKALEDANLKIENVNSIILNGGSTRVPFVQKHLASFVGEEKIAKSVNTDESCALGTTLRGLRLKTQSAKPNDVKVIDKAFHNFEINVNEAAEELTVFKKGSVVENVSRINIGKITDKLSVGLYQDGRLFKSYSFEDVLKKTEKFVCKSKDSKELFAQFSLDHNKIFDLVKVEVECVREDKSIFGKLLNKGKTTEEATILDEEEIEVEESSNSTNSTNSTVKRATPKAPKTVHVPLPKAVYPGVKPFLRTTKDKLHSKLAYLKSKDEEKIAIDHVKNVLEAKCYDLRSYIDSQEEVLVTEIDNLDSYTSYVGEVIEWLEFESEDATRDDVEIKTAELNDKKKELQRYAKIATTDVSIAGIKKIHEDGVDIASKLQDRLLEFGSEVHEIREKWVAEGFDFDKENAKLRVQLLIKGEDKLLSIEKKLDEYQENLTAVGELVALPEAKFNKLSKEALYTHYESLSSGIAALVTDLVDIESSHRDRIEALDRKFGIFSSRKLQKELKEKLKQAQKEAKEQKSEEEEEEENEGAIIEEEDEDIISSSEAAEEFASTESEPAEAEPTEATEPVVEPELEHDEL